MATAGCVYRKAGKWAVRVEAGKDPATGKRKMVFRGGFRTKREAEKIRTELLAEINKDKYIAPTKQRVDEFLDEWLIAIKPTLRPSTWYSYDRNLRLHVIPRIGRLLLTELDGGHLNKLYAVLLEVGRQDQKAGTGLSPKSVRYVHVIVHRAMKDAVRWQRLRANPADQADPPRMGTSPEAPVWSGDETREFLARSAAEDDRYFAAWRVAATTGARRGEVLGLRWSDIDLETGQARIAQTVIAVHHEVQMSTPKTAKGRRSVALDSVTVTALRAHRATQAAERLLMGEGYTDHGLVFALPTGHPYHPERFSREFDRRVLRYGLPHITLHGLRHSWATQALAGGVHPRVVQQRLGHSTVAVTLDTYSHVVPQQDMAAAELIAKGFSL